MQVWRNSSADIYYNDGTKPIINDTGYIVRLDGGTLEITYDDGDGAVCYRGMANGDGHYELRAPERDGLSVSRV